MNSPTGKAAPLSMETASSATDATVARVGACVESDSVTTEVVVGTVVVVGTGVGLAATGGRVSSTVVFRNSVCGSNHTTTATKRRTTAPTAVSFARVESNILALPLVLGLPYSQRPGSRLDFRTNNEQPIALSSRGSRYTYAPPCQRTMIEKSVGQLNQEPHK